MSFTMSSLQSRPQACFRLLASSIGDTAAGNGAYSVTVLPAKRVRQRSSRLQCRYSGNPATRRRNASSAVVSKSNGATKPGMPCGERSAVKPMGGCRMKAASRASGSSCEMKGMSKRVCLDCAG